MIKKLMKDNVPSVMLKGIPTDNAVARKCIGLTDASKRVNIQDFRLACMHTTPQNSVSVIGASRWPQTSFDWYDSASAKVTFPTTEVAFNKNYDDDTAEGYSTTFYPSNPTGGNFYWDRHRLWELASQVLPKVRTADGIPDDAEIVEPGTPGETVYGFGGQANYTQAYNTMAFHRPIQDVFYSANDCKSEHAITNYWTEAQIMGNGNGGITVTPYYSTGQTAGGDGVAGNKLIVKHTSDVKMGIECIFSADGLDDYLSASRNTQTYHGVDGIFNIVTKGFLKTPPTGGESESVGVTKFYDMKTECKRIAPNTYYLNDDDYYRISHGLDDYNGNSAYIHCTMFANGFPQFHLASQNWVIVYKRESYPNYYCGVSAQGTPGDKTKDVWQGAFGMHNPGDGNWYYPYWFSTKAAAQSFINENLTGYSADFSTDDCIEPRYTYSRRANEKYSTCWNVATADFPNYGQIIALNYHFTAI